MERNLLRFHLWIRWVCKSAWIHLIVESCMNVFTFSVTNCYTNVDDTYHNACKVHMIWYVYVCQHSECMGAKNASRNTVYCNTDYSTYNHKFCKYCCALPWRKVPFLMETASQWRPWWPADKLWRRRPQRPLMDHNCSTALQHAQHRQWEPNSPKLTNRKTR